MSVKAIPFFNFTDKVFSWTWDGVPYTFEPMTSFLMEDWKAAHFAKHLVNHVLNMEGKSVADQLRGSYIARALPSLSRPIEVEASRIETELLNIEGHKPKIGKKKISDGGEFEGVA